MESRSTPGATASAKTDLDIDAIGAAKFRSLLTPLPTDAEHQVLRARLEIAERQYADAAKDLEARGTKQNNQYDAQYWLAIAQREQGLLAEAELPWILFSPISPSIKPHSQRK